MYAQADTSVSFAHMTPCDNRLFNIKCLCFLYMILLDKFLYSQWNLNGLQQGFYHQCQSEQLIVGTFNSAVTAYM